MKKIILVLNFLGFFLSIFFISCTKSDEPQINITDEVEKVEGFLANYDKEKEESTVKPNSIVTVASDAYIARIQAKLADLLKEFESKSKLKAAVTNYAGILETANYGCGAGVDRYDFFFDCEDGRQNSGAYPAGTWASTGDSKGNFHLKLCKVDLALFKRVRNRDYALVRLSSYVPDGISYFYRYFDTEDNNNINNIYINDVSQKGNTSLYPTNVVDGNMYISFYFLPQQQTSSYTLPAIGRPYGVFGNLSCNLSYSIYTDDEDYKNGNFVKDFYLWDDVSNIGRTLQSDATKLNKISSFGNDTRLYVDYINN